MFTPYYFANPQCLCGVVNEAGKLMSLDELLQSLTSSAISVSADAPFDRA